MKATMRIAALVAFATLAAPMVASAQEGAHVLRPGTRPWWIAGGVGGDAYFDGYGHFRTMINFGYHFSRDSSGPALGGEVQLGLGDYDTEFDGIVRFWWDIHITRYAIYLSPSAGAGFGFVGAPNACPGGVCGAAYGAFEIQGGFEGKIILWDRMLLFLRPINLTAVFAPWYNCNGAPGCPNVWGRYDFMVGIGVIL